MALTASQKQILQDTIERDIAVRTAAGQYQSAGEAWLTLLLMSRAQQKTYLHTLLADRKTKNAADKLTLPTRKAQSEAALDADDAEVDVVDVEIDNL